jgi:hypothetical protein
MQHRSARGRWLVERSCPSPTKPQSSALAIRVCLCPFLPTQGSKRLRNLTSVIYATALRVHDVGDHGSDHEPDKQAGGDHNERLHWLKSLLLSRTLTACSIWHSAPNHSAPMMYATIAPITTNTVAL